MFTYLPPALIIFFASLLSYFVLQLNASSSFQNFSTDMQIYFICFEIFTISLFSIFWGRLADDLGPKKTLSVSLPLIFLSLWLYTFSLSPLQFIFTSALLTIGVASLHICHIKIIVLFYKEEDYISKLAAHFSFALISFMSLQLFYQFDVAQTLFHIFPYIFLVVTISLYAFINLFLKSETVKSYPKDLHFSLSRIKEVTLHPIEFSYLFNASFPLAGIISFLFISPYILTEKRFIYHEYLLICVLISASFIFSSYITHKFYRKITPDVMIRASNLLIVLASFLFVNIISRPYFSTFAFVFPMLIWGYSMSISLPCSLSSAIKLFKNDAGLIIGLLTALQGFLSCLYLFLSMTFNADYKFTLAATLLLIALHGSWIYYVMIVQRLKP